MNSEPLTLSVSEFVAFVNQTLEYAYPSVVVTGELANFRISKNRWVYFDLKDDESSVRFFGTVYNLGGPLEDGMMLSVRGAPRLHPQFGFSITVQQISLVGEGTIKRAAKLLEAKLQKEGLFDPARKRVLPYPPKVIGLITSGESAAYADFTKILRARWGGVDIVLADVQVQGARAPEQIERAIDRFNQLPEPPEILVIIRGGGSAEDLQAFSEERVVRAVASSRIPTLVAIGHEIDSSLAERAADMLASTPSNAAELITPDKTHVARTLQDTELGLHRSLQQVLRTQKQHISRQRQEMTSHLLRIFSISMQHVSQRRALLQAYDPQATLTRGYALVRSRNAVVTSVAKVRENDIVQIEMQDGYIDAKVTGCNKKEQ